MDGVLPLLVSGAIAFAATNIDDLFLLVGFFSDPAYRPRAIIAGQFIGIAVLIGASLVCALVALVIPSRLLGLLGVVPIGIGAGRLWSARRAHVAGADAGDAGAPVDLAPVNPASRAGLLPAGAAQAIAIAAATITNGGDDLGVYAPMFATGTRAGVGPIVDRPWAIHPGWRRPHLIEAWLMKPASRRISRSTTRMQPLNPTPSPAAARASAAAAETDTTA